MSPISSAASKPSHRSATRTFSQPVVLIYRNELLAPSETFIPAQAEALTGFTPVYVGLKRIPGLTLPPDRCILLAEDTNTSLGRLAYLRKKVLGPTRHDLQRLRALKPALIHAHFGVDSGSALLLAKELKIPLIVTFHGFDATMDDRHLGATSLAAKLYLRRRKQIIEGAAAIICVSNFIRSAVLAQGFTSASTRVHYIGIDTQLFVPSLDIQREPIVLFVGRLVEKKGCEFLIEAMRKLQDQNVNAELQVVGAGPLRATLEDQAKARLSKFRFLGHQSPQQIKELMNKASVFCAPSIVAKSGDSEGFGMVFLEAQSMGLPVVSFNTGGISEAVEHERTGLLAPSHDVERLSEYLIRLLTERSVWQAFSEAGRCRVREHFDVRSQTAKLERIYSEILS